MNGKKHRIVFSVLVIVLVLAALFMWYVSDFYHATDDVYGFFSESGEVKISEYPEYLLLDGKGEESALIFYPGAKVEYTAYVPLMYEMAESGVDVFIVRMPFNLAFFGISRADDIISQYSYETWYISGHSLGGAMAACYAEKNAEKLDGIIFLASFTTKDLKSCGLRVLSVYGTEDGVLNMKRIEEEKDLLPSDYTEVIIEGGNHACFGSYGEQKGDGEALIFPSVQRRLTADAVTAFIR